MPNGRNHNCANGRPRQREYDKSARTRAAILAAAMDEFAEHGYGGARVDRIAKSAKLNNHALYYHFGDKEELFQAVLEHGYEALRANLEPRDPAAMAPEAAMAKIVEDVFEFVQRMPKHMAIAMCLGMRCTNSNTSSTIFAIAASGAMAARSRGSRLARSAS